MIFSLTDNKLIWKEKMWRTYKREKIDPNLIEHIEFIWTLFPLGSATKECRDVLTLCNKLREEVMWSVAPLYLLRDFVYLPTKLL